MDVDRQVHPPSRACVLQGIALQVWKPDGQLWASRTSCWGSDFWQLPGCCMLVHLSGPLGDSLMLRMVYQAQGRPIAYGSAS